MSLKLSFSTFGRALLALSSLVFFSSCGWIEGMAGLERKIAFSVTVTPTQIYEGQQAHVTIALADDYGTKDVSWSLYQNDSTTLAPNSDFVAVQGSVSLSATNSKDFYITSLPNSVPSGTSKTYTLTFTSKGMTKTFPISVMDSGTSSTVSIVSTGNGGFVNSANAASYPVSGVCSTVGSDVNLSAQVGSQTTSGVVACSASYTWSINLNFSSVSTDGSVTLTATHAGDGGTLGATSMQVIKDTVAPTMAISSPAAASAINASQAPSFSISGTCSEFTRILTGTITSSGGGTPVSMSALCLDISGTGEWSGTANISSLGDGTITAHFTHEDAAGNSAAASRSFVKDTLLPTITIASPAANQMFNGTSYNAVSITGACNKSGATVTASGPLSGTLTTTCSGTSYSLSGLNLDGTDGLKNITLQIQDASGNTAQASLAVQKDITPPTAVLTGAPGSFSSATALNVTVGGADVVQYVYKVGSSAVDCTAAAGYSAATGIATKITDSIGVDGAKRLCVRGIDANGNVQALASATIVDWTKDTVAPILTFTSPAAGSYVNGAAQASFAVGGTCSEVGTNNVSITGDAASVQASCVAGTPNTWSANVDFSVASDGPVFLLISQTDSAGNLGQKTRAFVKDTVNPVIAFTSPASGAYVNNANKSAFTVSGTCDTYSATPNVTLTGAGLSSAVTTACDGAHWTASLAFINGDAAVSITSTIADAAGNTSTDTRSFVKDTTNPTLAITSPAAGSYINNTNKASFAVSGTCSDPGTGNVVISGGASATVNCVAGTPNSWSASLNFTAATDGPVSITVTHTDAAGNTVAPTLALNKDTVAPVIGWTLPLAQACASNTSATSLQVSGTCTSGDGSVTLSSAQLASAVTTACSSGTWSTTINLNVSALSDLAAFSVQASQTDVAGNGGALARGFKKLGSVPTVVLGGWSDIYSVGPKTYASNPTGVTPAAVPGTVRISWADWPASNTCQPDAVIVYRANASGGSGSIVSNTDYPSGIPANIKTFTDSTLQGATAATVGSPTDFGNAWYYRLKVLIAGNSYDVTSPTQIAEARVVAPPANMALMHRWVANQEMCGLMGLTPDSTNNYRCAYSGWGKITGNYYDMTNDLLVDRGELGCNFTAQCGASANQPCLASVFSTTNPQGAAIAGADGQVFYNDDGSNARCYVKVSGTWREANDTNVAMTSTVRAVMSTPMGNKPPIVTIGQAASYATCQAYTVSIGQLSTFTSGPKRLLRNKEWKAAAAWSPTLTDAQIVSLENGGAGNCNTDNAHSLSTTDRTYAGTKAFYSGSATSTTNCVSRYGIQDLVGNVWEWTSDQLGSCSAGGNTCVGVTSALDTGNTDMNGFPFDSVTSPGSGLVSEWNIESMTYGANYFSVPLGIPMITNDGGNAISISSWLTPTNKLHSDRFYLYPSNGNTQRGLFVGGAWYGGSGAGRWASFWNNPPSGQHSSFGMRCAVPLSY